MGPDQPICDKLNEMFEVNFDLDFGAYLVKWTYLSDLDVLM